MQKGHLVRSMVVFLSLFAAISLRAETPATLPAASPGEIESAIRYLASDDLEGRGIRTEGIKKAATYIGEQFMKAGLQPVPAPKVNGHAAQAAGVDAYFQNFDYQVSRILGPDTGLTLGKRKCAIGADCQPLSLSGAGEFGSDVIFVGYGISDAASKYDDYAGLDVKGKVVLAMRFEPRDERGRSRLTKDGKWSANAELGRKAEVAAKHGAAALIIVTPPSQKSEDRLMPFNGRFMGSAASIPVFQVRVALAEEQARQAGASLADLQRRIDREFKPQSQAIKNLQAEGKVALEGETVLLRNVVGILPGKGPHADEYIVIGGHYDHLGIRGESGPGKRAEIYHGADDNASGTAAVLAMARIFGKAGPQDRSLVFICFTGEEIGLVGSRYFVDHPLVPRDRIVAMVNFDMVGRIRADVLLIGGAGTSPQFDAIVAQADADSPLQAKSVWRNGSMPTDTESFLRVQIPALFFYSGMENDYHKPTDEADKINFAGEAQAVDVAANVIRQLAPLPRIEYSAPDATQPATNPAQLPPAPAPTTQP